MENKLEEFDYGDVVKEVESVLKRHPGETRQGQGCH